MPTMTLPVDNVVTYVSGEWDANTGYTYDAVSTNDGDTTYIAEGDDGHGILFRLTDPTVASGGISSITSIQLLTYGKLHVRSGGDGRVTFQFTNFPSNVSAEAIVYPNSGAYQSRNGAAITTNSSGGSITYSNLEDVRILVLKNGYSSTPVQITYIAIEVVYVAAIAGDDAIFFGHNF